MQPSTTIRDAMHANGIAAPSATELPTLKTVGAALHRAFGFADSDHATMIQFGYDAHEVGQKKPYIHVAIALPKNGEVMLQLLNLVDGWAQKCKLGQTVLLKKHPDENGKRSTMIDTLMFDIPPGSESVLLEKLATHLAKNNGHDAQAAINPTKAGSAFSSR